MPDSLYVKYGGSVAVSAVVHEFYTRIQADRNLASYFEHVDMPGLIAHQTNFIGKALGGPEIYDGADLVDVHKGLRIDADAFAAVAGHLAAALQDGGFEETDCKSILELIASYCGQIVSG